VKERSDFRRYGAVVRRHGWWIAVLALGSAALTLLVGALTPETYTAAALVGIIDRSKVTAFDPRFLPIERDLPTFEPYPALATSEAVLRDLLTVLGDDAPGDGSLEALRGHLSAALSADKVLLRLTAIADSPAGAARLADAWAEVVVAHASRLYGAMDAALIAWYEDQLEAARAQVTIAREALVQHDVAVAEQGWAQELTTVDAEVDLLESEARALRAIQRDAQAARDAAASAAAAEAESLATTVARLQQRALQPLAKTLPSAGTLPDDPLATLDQVDRLVSQRMEEIDKALALHGARAVQLRSALAKQKAERADLALALQEAEKQVLLLTRELKLAQLAAKDSRIQVALASPASVPTRPTSGGVQPLAAGVAAVAGLALGSALAVLVVERQPREDATSPGP